MAYIVSAYVVMVYTAIAHMVTAFIVTAYVVITKAVPAGALPADERRGLLASAHAERRTPTAHARRQKSSSGPSSMPPP